MEVVDLPNERFIWQFFSDASHCIFKQNRLKEKRIWEMLGAELFWKVEIYICYLQRKLPTINNLLTRTKIEKLLAIQMG